MVFLHQVVSPHRRAGEDPAVLGPHFWTVLHVLSYRVKHCGALAEVADAVAPALRCAYCRHSAKTFVRARDFECGPRFWNDMHNWVNAKLGKRIWAAEANAARYGEGSYADWSTFEASFARLRAELGGDAAGGSDAGYQRDHELRARAARALRALEAARAEL